MQQASLTYSDNPTSVSLLVDIGDWQGLRRNAAEYLGEDSEDTDYLRRTNRFTVREMVHCMDLLQTQSERFPGVLDCLKLSAPGKFLKTNDPPYEIAQKYGNLNEGGTFLHAAGVIYTEEPIAVCVMTYGPTDSVSLFSGFVELVTDYTEESIVRRKAEEERLAEEKRRAEEERLAEEQAQREAEEERIRAAELAEQERLVKQAEEAEAEAEVAKGIGGGHGRQSEHGEKHLPVGPEDRIDHDEHIIKGELAAVCGEEYVKRGAHGLRDAEYGEEGIP